MEKYVNCIAPLKRLGQRIAQKGVVLPNPVWGEGNYVVSLYDLIYYLNDSDFLLNQGN